MTYDAIIDQLKTILDAAGQATRGKNTSWQSIQVDPHGAWVTGGDDNGSTLEEIQSGEASNELLSIPLPAEGIPRSLVKGFLDLCWSNTDRPFVFDVTDGVLVAQIR